MEIHIYKVIFVVIFHGQVWFLAAIPIGFIDFP